MVCFIEILHAIKYHIIYSCYKDNKTTFFLFFAHFGYIGLIKKYIFSIVMDCIYKTNRFRMSMLHIVEMISFNISFINVVIFL